MKSGFCVVFLLAFGLAACGPEGRDGEPTAQFSGAYATTTPEGRVVQVQLEEVNGTVRAIGQIDAEPFVAIAPRVSLASGTALDEHGDTTPMRFALNTSGDQLTIWTSELGDLTLAESPDAVKTGPPGLFSGNFQAANADGIIAYLSVTQSGSLVSGTGEVLGDTVGFTGRETAGDQLEGFVTFSDGTRSHVTVRAVSANELDVNGLGGPQELVRR